MRARTYLAILHLLGLALVLVMVPSANGQWPMFHKDVRNSGVTGHDGAESDSTAWSYDISHSGWSSSEDLIWASPVVADTCVYVAARNGKVYCFGRTCGDSLWAADVSDTLSSTPCISDGHLYVLGGPTDRRVHCIDAADGDSIWASSQLGSSWYYGGGREAWMESSPVVVGDSVLFVGSRDGKVYCLDTDDGSEIWSTEIGLAVVSSPGYSAKENRLYVGTVEIPTDGDMSAVVCLDADDGDPLWRHVYEEGNDKGTMGSPLVVDSDDAVYVGANTVWDECDTGGALLRFALTYTGDSQPPPYGQPEGPLWTAGVECDVRGTPVLLDGLVYVSTGKGLFAFDEDDGSMEIGTGPGAGVKPGGNEELWSSFAVSARHTVAEQETLLFIGNGGANYGDGIYALDLDLDTVWSYDTDCRAWSSPAIDNSRVFACDNDGGIYCFVNDSQSGRLIAPAVDLASSGGPRPVILGDGTAAIEKVAGRRAEVASHNWPNPFAKETTIRLTVETAGRQPLDLRVYDLSGRLVRTLMSSQLVHGSHSVQWDGRWSSGRAAAPGIYYYRSTGAGIELTDTMILLR